VARADLPQLPVQYRDFAGWQRGWRPGDALARQVGYWREHVDGAPAALALPSRHWRPAPEQVTGGRLHAVLDRPDTQRLHDLCHAHHATPFMVLLAGLGTVLARWSGQHDVVVGVPITGRTDVGTENLIGFFVNTVPMRVHVSEESSFAELLGQVRAAALDGYEHAEAPFDRIVQQLPVMRVPGRTPVFQVALNVLDVFDRESLDGLVTELVPAQPPPSKFDLALTAREFGGQLHLELEYDAGRYSDAMTAVLLDQVRELLRYAVAGTAAFPGRRHRPRQLVARRRHHRGLRGSPAAARDVRPRGHAAAAGAAGRVRGQRRRPARPRRRAGAPLVAGLPLGRSLRDE